MQVVAVSNRIASWRSEDVLFEDALPPQAVLATSFFQVKIVSVQFY